MDVAAKAFRAWARAAEASKVSGDVQCAFMCFAVVDVYLHGTAKFVVYLFSSAATKGVAVAPVCLLLWSVGCVSCCGQSHCMRVYFGVRRRERESLRTLLIVIPYGHSCNLCG